ncbi:MAG TPA: PmoA family protein, partial [Pyrinomonadaceae bacterium]|nr:PmoA family protein [Pyrinomonadaceae bacterium]
MMRILLIIGLIGIVALSMPAQGFRVVADDSKQRIDVTIDGNLLTSYRYEQRIRRPVLLPIMTAGGNFVTRGFPIETRDGEDIGHPHQVGCSLSFGSVNGVDFWNNSPYRTPKELEHMGRIVHRRIVKSKNGKRSAELVTESDWVMPDGSTVLRETSRYRFSIAGNSRLIDRETTLTAVVEAIFGDNKEGFFAVHVTREMQEPSDIPEKITDSKGVITTTTDNSPVTGSYFNSEGLRDEKNFWGTTGKWAAASGRIKGEDVTVAVFVERAAGGFRRVVAVRGVEGFGTDVGRGRHPGADAADDHGVR